LIFVTGSSPHLNDNREYHVGKVSIRYCVQLVAGFDRIRRCAALRCAAK